MTFQMHVAPRWNSPRVLVRFASLIVAAALVVACAEDPLGPSSQLQRAPRTSSLVVPGNYVVTELPGLGDGASLALNINNVGDVVGWSLLPDGSALDAVVWPAAGGAPSDLGSLGGFASEGDAINDAGVVVGQSFVAGNSADLAASWPLGSVTPQALGSLEPNSRSQALGINTTGTVVGWSVTDFGRTVHAVSWSAASADAKDLGVLPGGSVSRAFAVNDAGTIVGESDVETPDGFVSHATVWPAGGGDPVDLGALGGSGTSAATDINTGGDVVGYSVLSSTFAKRATRWPAGGGAPQELPTPSGSDSYATGINDAGDIVGNITDASGDHATLWPADGSAPQDLGAPGGVPSVAVAINNDGKIAGHIATANGTRPVTWTRGVANPPVAPVVGAITAPTAPVQVDAVVSASAAFTDDNSADTHTAVFAWGDGSSSAGTVTESSGSGSVAGTHSYATPGVYTITLTVTDNSGLTGESVFRYVVTYDPSAGFVTGGGWINSPAGAYVADPTIVGKAKFGFVSRYQKGATIPTGTTQFQFDVAGVDFTSTSYDWLVIAGGTAKFKGLGTINGEAGYAFMLSAVDGDITGKTNADRFRIKIWNAATGVVIYDNQPAVADDAEASTALGGGSISIHQ